MTQQKEARMVNEWLAAEHPTALQWKRVRLGPLPGKVFAAMYKVMLRWADAIFVEDGVVTIVEAKLKPDLGAIAQLEAYEVLFRQTPEFSDLRSAEIRLVYLVPRTDLIVDQLAQARGIEIIIYKPAWLNDALITR